jgi:hypothetical protein
MRIPVALVALTRCGGDAVVYTPHPTHLSFLNPLSIR